MKCKYCGDEIDRESLKCPHCGREVRIVPDYNLFEEDILSSMIADEEDKSDKKNVNEIKNDTKKKKKSKKKDGIKHGKVTRHLHAQTANGRPTVPACKIAANLSF